MTPKTARQVLDEAITEAQWQETVTEYATTRGWLWYHPNLSLRDEAGFPDLVLVRGGRVLFVELKTERGRLRAEQVAWLQALAKAEMDVMVSMGMGQEPIHRELGVRVWRPRDWENVERELA